MSPKRHKPGEKAPESRQHGLVNRNGRRTGEERTVTKGERLPPTPHRGQTYVMVDRTKHKK